MRAKDLRISGQPEPNPYVVHKDPQIFPDSSFLPPSIRNRDHFGPYTVPSGFVFCMGDNRDNSLDSRYWGFVPENHIVGKAFPVWMNVGNFKRIGFLE